MYKVGYSLAIIAFIAPTILKLFSFIDVEIIERAQEGRIIFIGYIAWFGIEVVREEIRKMKNQ